MICAVLKKFKSYEIKKKKIVFSLSKFSVITFTDSFLIQDAYTCGCQ